MPQHARVNPALGMGRAASLGASSERRCGSHGRQRQARFLSVPAPPLRILGAVFDRAAGGQSSTGDPVRTTLNLSDDLLAEAKAFAGREKLTLTRLIEEGLALRLRQHQRPSAAAPLPLPVHQGRGGGLAPAVADPRSYRALLDAADGLVPA